VKEKIGKKEMREVNKHRQTPYLLTLKPRCLPP